MVYFLYVFLDFLVYPTLVGGFMIPLIRGNQKARPLGELSPRSEAKV